MEGVNEVIKLFVELIPTIVLCVVWFCVGSVATVCGSILAFLWIIRKG